MKYGNIFRYILLMGIISSGLDANTQIKQLKYAIVDDSTGSLSISVDGKIDSRPELMIRDNIIQLEIPNVVVWPKIEKKITLGKTKFDTTVLAYQFDKKLARVRIILPFKKGVNRNKDIRYRVKNGSIDIYFPIKPQNDLVKYDEKYLDQLLRDKRNIQKSNTNIAFVKKNDFFKKKIPPRKQEKIRHDGVKVSASSLDKIKSKTSFSLEKYIGKFVGFLAIVLLLFYSVVTLMRKGMLKKDKLGFLNKMKPVKVLSNTYVGPKKNLIMVQAHEQIFLIGMSEKGMHFLSEIKDVTGILKEGEKTVSGHNFDTKLENAKVDDVAQTLKEKIDLSSEEKSSGLMGFLKNNESKENGQKFSDKIKNKVKKLKTLQ